MQTLIHAMDELTPSITADLESSSERIRVQSLDFQSNRQSRIDSFSNTTLVEYSKASTSNINQISQSIDVHSNTLRDLILLQSDGIDESEQSLDSLSTV